jgi:hypothetical protein
MLCLLNILLTSSQIDSFLIFFVLVLSLNNEFIRIEFYNLFQFIFYKSFWSQGFDRESDELTSG